jgi:hypothetical protein
MQRVSRAASSHARGYVSSLFRRLSWRYLVRRCCRGTCRRPHRHEDHGAESPVKGEQCKWGVATGDEHEDHRVIEARIRRRAVSVGQSMR